MVGTAEFSSHRSTIRRGYYGLLDVGPKLEILRELVARVLETGIFKENLDEFIKERQTPVTTNKEETLSDSRKKESKDCNMLSNGMQATEGHGVGFQASNSTELATQHNGAIEYVDLTLRYRIFLIVSSIHHVCQLPPVGSR